MIRDLRSSKGDLLDLEFEDTGHASIPNRTIASCEPPPELSTKPVLLNIGRFICGLLTRQWRLNKQHKTCQPTERQKCNSQREDKDKQVLAAHFLKLVVLLGLRLQHPSQTSIVLADTEWRLMFKPLICVFVQMRCNKECELVYNAALSESLVLRFRARFPSGLQRAEASRAVTSPRRSHCYSISDAFLLSEIYPVSNLPQWYSLLRRMIARKRAKAAKAAKDSQKTENENKGEEKSEDKEDEKKDEDDEEKEEPFVATRTPTSVAELEWVRIKEKDGIENIALDRIMDMVGLEEVKSYLLQVLGKVNTLKRQGLDMSQERMGTVFMGNPGTGKTVVAKQYNKFLANIGALPGSKFIEMTGLMLSREGVGKTKDLIASIYTKDDKKKKGGTFFVDDVDQLMEYTNGERIVDYIMSVADELKGKVAFLFAGPEDKVKKEFLEYRPKLAGFIPHRLAFADFNENELLEILQQTVARKYKDRLKIEDGNSGLYMRIVSKRLSRRRGNFGFGNARDVENAFDRMIDRQAARVEKARKNDEAFDDLFLVKEDIIGPEPGDALANSQAFKKLQRLVGLSSVKRSVQGLVDRVKYNYKRELKELPIIDASLNRLFLGSPGTGKTTVAGLYGQILADIGILSSSDVVYKTATDFIGQYIGDSEKFTTKILSSAKGKVLVVDEAYMWAGPKRSGKSEPDCYRQGVIDTLVSKIQSTPGEDRAVLLLGYEDRMMDLLGCNPGLARRFSPEGAFKFEDYDDEQLRTIMNTKLEDQGLQATDFAKDVAIDVLAKCRRKPDFGNAGEIENLLGLAKDRFQQRVSQLPSEECTGDVQLEPEDFDPDYNRIKDAVTNCKKLFQDVVGCEDIIKKMIGFIQTSENLKKMNLPLEEYLPFNFIFKGPPGTGKTTTARKFGKLFYDMGLLGSTDVVECSVTDLIGEYCGQTAPKTLHKLDSALGKVLFIDEAYRLGDGKFTSEARDELVDSLTKPRYKGKMIVILAGYEDEMNNLLQMNPGLSSRFTDEINFENLNSSHCLELLVQKVEKVPGFDASSLRTSVARANAMLTFSELSQLSGWGNGRDIETVAKRVISSALRSGTTVNGTLTVKDQLIVDELEGFYEERSGRSGRNRRGAASMYI